MNRIEKVGRGKGNKKNFNLLFDNLTIVDNPAPAALVELRAKRYAKGLDIWSGKPLMIEVEYEVQCSRVPQEPENWELEDLDEF